MYLPIARLTRILDRGQQFWVSSPEGRSNLSAITIYPHIVVDDAGTARIGHSRYKVEHLAAEHYHYGWTAEELLRQHPDLRPEEVYAALTYFYDHHDDLVAAINATSDKVNVARSQQTLSRDELLRRKSG